MEEEVLDKTEKEKIKERVVNIGDLLQAEKSDEAEFQQQEEQEQPQKSWNERISRSFSRVTAVGLDGKEKEEYLADTEEIVDAMCEFFDVEHNLPYLLQEIKSGELTPKESMLYLGICMIGYLLVVRMKILDKIGEKLKLRNKKESEGDEIKK